MNQGWGENKAKHGTPNADESISTLACLYCCSSGTYHRPWRRREGKDYALLVALLAALLARALLAEIGISRTVGHQG